MADQNDILKQLQADRLSRPDYLHLQKPLLQSSGFDDQLLKKLLADPDFSPHQMFTMQVASQAETRATLLGYAVYYADLEAVEMILDHPLTNINDDRSVLRYSERSLSDRSYNEGVSGSALYHATLALLRADQVTYMKMIDIMQKLLDRGADPYYSGHCRAPFVNLAEMKFDSFGIKAFEAFVSHYCVDLNKPILCDIETYKLPLDIVLDLDQSNDEIAPKVAMLERYGARSANPEHLEAFKNGARQQKTPSVAKPQAQKEKENENDKESPRKARLSKLSSKVTTYSKKSSSRSSKYEPSYRSYENESYLQKSYSKNLSISNAFHEAMIDDKIQRKTNEAFFQKKEMYNKLAVTRAEEKRRQEELAREAALARAEELRLAKQKEERERIERERYRGSWKLL